TCSSRSPPTRSTAGHNRRYGGHGRAALGSESQIRSRAMFHNDRRQFLRATGSAFAALAASGCVRSGLGGSFRGYGPLSADPAGLIDLPTGFSYRVVSALGEPMDDGGTVP